MSYDSQIVFFSPSFPKNEENTIAVPTIYLLSKNLRKIIPNNIRITVLTLHFPFVERKYSCFGATVIALGGANVGFPRRLFTWNKAIKTLKKLDKELPIKLIHNFWLAECSFISSRFISSKIPKLVTIMGQDTEPNNRYKKLVKKRIPIVYLNQNQPQKLKNAGFKNLIQKIPWGIENLNFGTQSELREVDLLFVSTFIPLKDPLKFLDIVSLLAKANKKLKVVLVGYGPLENKVRTFISKNLSELNIQVINKLKREEVLDLMSKSKVLVHTSRFESYGMVMVEALSRGCKVVSSNVGYAKDYSSANWSKASTENEFEMEIKKQLATPFIDDLNLPTFKDIAKQYLAVYQNLTEGYLPNIRLS